MQLLIYTSQDDLHADAVIRLLSDCRNDISVLRVNAETLATNAEFCFHWSNSGDFKKQHLSFLDSGVSAEDISVIWYRKPGKPHPHPSLTDTNAQGCSVTEYRELLRSLPGLFPQALWVNEYWSMQRYASKVNQISIARQVELAIPETIITNDIEAIRDLARRHPQIIIKPLAYTGFAVSEKQFTCFTNLISYDDTLKFEKEDLAYAPAIFQQRINKAQELRVTVIGDEVFACEIQTVVGTPENIDWRIEGVVDLPHAIVDIPCHIANRLKMMLKLMGLRFGAFDLILDSSGEYYFIEVNPNGQYYWIELLTGAPLSKAMASLIGSMCDSLKST